MFSVVIVFGYVLGTAFVQDTQYRMHEIAWRFYGLDLHLDVWYGDKAGNFPFICECVIRASLHGHGEFETANNGQKVTATAG